MELSRLEARGEGNKSVRGRESKQLTEEVNQDRKQLHNEGRGAQFKH